MFLFSLSDSHVRTTELIPSHPNNNPGVITFVAKLLSFECTDKITCPSFSTMLSHFEENNILIFLLLFIFASSASSSWSLGRWIFSLGIEDIAGIFNTAFTPVFG